MQKGSGDAEENQNRVRLLKRINNNIAATLPPGVLKKHPSTNSIKASVSTTSISTKPNVTRSDENTKVLNSTAAAGLQLTKSQENIWQRPFSPKNYVFPAYGTTYGHFLPNKYKNSKSSK